MSRSEEMGNMFKVWWTYFLMDWHGYKALWKLLLTSLETSDFTKWEPFFSRNQEMEGLSHHFSLWNVFPISTYFFPIRYIWIKVETADSKPRTFWVWSNRNPKLQLWLRLLQCWFTVFLISSFLYWQKNIGSTIIT